MVETLPGEKAVDQNVANRSVVDRPSSLTSSNVATAGGAFDTSVFWLAAAYQDEVTPWGGHPKMRDSQLRAFVTQENVYGSALGIICARNAAFNWELTGPKSTASRMHDILEMANLGLGWLDLVVKVSIDLYTQDSGAFIEVVRERDTENAAVIGINHLDAARCYHTGSPDAPVIYMDRMGRYHLLKWYNVVTLSEMPTPIERLYGMQYCALSRLLRAVQILKSINTYKYEKVSGRNTKAVVMVQGVTTKQMNDAIDDSQAQADNIGLTRYMRPILVGGLDPKANVSHDIIELAGLPDGYDEEVTFKQYINQIAMAFGSDYQEFAPLPGGNLGTSAQSEVLHLKNRGKGPAIFQKLLANALNQRILPSNCEFNFKEQDVEQEEKEAQVKFTRSRERAIRITSGEINVDVARQIAADEGDLSPELLDRLGEGDVTPDVLIDDGSSPESQIGTDNQGARGAQPIPTAPLTTNPARPPTGLTGPKAAASPAKLVAVAKKEGDRAGPEADRVALEETVAGAIEDGFGPLRERIRARILANYQD